MSAADDPGAAYEALRAEMSEVLVGNETIIERLTIALLTGGHVLLEGVPGVAKTTTAELFARATGLEHSRIQLTPDSLPADITGTSVYREATGEFTVRKGPVFANVVVADEINRATPKTQSALLEAMQERRVTIDGEPYPLPDPFLVVATQNPIEMEGTFELPEAQRDRFQFKLRVEIPERDDERDLLTQFDARPDLGPETVEQVIDPDRIPAMQATVADVYVAPDLTEYLLDLVTTIREHASVEYGPSPRAALALQDATKARAALRSREYVIPDDVKALAEPVLGHRLVLGTDAVLSDVDPTDVVAEALSEVTPPSAVDQAPADAAAATATPDGESAPHGAGGAAEGSEASETPGTPETEAREATPTEATESPAVESQAPPDDTATEVSAAGATSGSDSDSSDGTADADEQVGTIDAEGQPGSAAVQYSKVMRLLQSRGLPVARAEIEAAAAEAHDIREAECAAIIDAAIDQQLLAERDGQLVPPDASADE